MVRRWQGARERLVSLQHCVLSVLILAFVFPAWARSLPAPKVASPMWLFRFSGAEGCCAVPFIHMVGTDFSMQTFLRAGLWCAQVIG